MASAREKNGKWYYRITITSQGKVRYLERGSYESKEDALEAGRLHESQIKRGSDIFIPTHITYEDLARDWLSDYAPVQYKNSTINTHKKVLKNYILPVLRDREIGVITTKDLQAIINDEAPRHTIDGLYKIRSTMSKTFNYAIINGYICKDPSEGVICPVDGR